MEADESTVIDELREIKLHLSLLTHDIRREAIRLFEETVLESESQIKMFRSMDNSRTTQDLATLSGLSLRSAQRLVQGLGETGFVSIRTQDRWQIPRVNLDRIYDWYLSAEKKV